MNDDFIPNPASELECGSIAPDLTNSSSDVCQVTEFQDAEILKAVAIYLENGWHVLPFNREVGYCTLKKAEQQTFTCDPQTIGLKFKGVDVGVDLHASQLVGIDVDCPEAAAFLTALLLPTRVIGREGKHTSWMLFRLEGVIAKNVSYKDYEQYGQAGAELGGVKVNAAVALPPSRHRKTSEGLRWQNDVELQVVEAAQFMNNVASCFALALIARHWPGPSSRHDPTLALAGTLARAGWSLDRAINAVRVLVELTNDHKLSDRLNEVKSTYERLQAGEQTSGLPSLIELLEPAAGGRAYLNNNLRSWLYPSKSDDGQGDSGTGPEFTGSLAKYAMSIADLLAIELPEQQFIVHPWLPVQALAMLFAVRGVGKTWASLELAISIALGHDFLAWPITKPRRVLFIDGEMSLTSLQYRIKKLLGTSQVPSNLTVLSSELLWRDNAGLNISEPKQQQRVDDYLAELVAKGNAPELIILDNLSSLVVGVDENSNSDMDQFNLWLVKLRSRGYAVLFVHHAGRNGDQRGATRREDLLDTVIKLDKRESLGISSTSGACFDISFTKLRGEPPKPIHLSVALTTDDQGYLHWQHEEGQKLSAYMKIVQAVYEFKPVSQSALAKQLACSRQHVHTQIKIGIEKGLLNAKALALTTKGIEAVKALTASTPEMPDYANAL